MSRSAEATPRPDSQSGGTIRSPDRLLRMPYRSSLDNTEREYLVYLPTGYDSETGRDWPVMLFLHGHGERGDGRDELNWVMSQGPLYETWIRRRTLPFIIVAPQLHMFDQRENGPDYLRDRRMEDIPVRLSEGAPERPAPFETPAPMTGATPADTTDMPLTLPIGWDLVEDDLLAMLDEVQSTLRTDRERLYLTGLSYGGFGTWYLASRHPERFAAIAPVVGWGHPDLMEPIAKHAIPLWVFAGGRDLAVELRHFYTGLNRLEELGHPDVRFTVHEDVGHDAWHRVYGGKDLYDWMLSQSLGD